MEPSPRRVALYDAGGRLGSTVFPAPEIVDLDEMERNLRRAIGRFWLSERRRPAAIVLPLQLARSLGQLDVQALAGDLYTAGQFEGIPILARDAPVDPLFVLL